MLKNIKSALNAPAVSEGGADSPAEKRKRKKAKEREAMAGVLAALGAPPPTPQEAPVGQATKVSFKQLVSQMPNKSLGSKKLATVVNRIKLITAGKRGKRLAMLKFDKSRQELEERNFKLALENRFEGDADDEREREDDDDDDQLSFYSALDYFAWAETGDEKCSTKMQAKESTKTEAAAEATQPEGHFNGFLADSKYILPEEQCDIPTFLHTKNCDRQLIDATRRLLRERHDANPDSFYEHDYQRMLNDDWTVTRFLLRRRLDPKRTAKLMEECGKFRRQYLMGEMQLWEFPREFHQAGGLFQYLPDRVGNQTLYMRVKMYRRVPEISDVFKAFILCVIEQCDVVNGGRGTAIIFDLSACGLQNVDLGFLYWLLNSFRNYCPKGVSYILVYNLPWFLSATCKLAMTWLSETNRRSLRFVSGDEIENFIAREHLPDYLGGTSKRNYRRIPRGCQPAIEVCERLDITTDQALKIKELFQEYLNDEVEEESHNENVNVIQANQTNNITTRQHEEEEESSKIYGDVEEHGHPASVSQLSRASTTLMSDSISRLRGPTSPPSQTAAAAQSSAGNSSSRSLTRNASSSSSDSLVPVVNLVSKASKFVAL